MTKRTRHRKGRHPSQTPASDRRFLTTDQLIQATGLSREQLWRGRAAGGLASGVHYVRVGRRHLWHQDNVRQWLTGLGLSASSIEQRPVQSCPDHRAEEEG